MSINSARSANIFRVSLCDILCVIPTFKDGFENLTFERKCIIFIADIGMDLA